MKVHYFQRYHGKENVATANTMLLLSRLYAYSPAKFFKLFRSDFFSIENFNPEISFELQKRESNSVPDAEITQDSFKIVVETKTTDWFYLKQLEKHLKAFSNEKYKILITLSSEPMNKKTKDDFEVELKKYNDKEKQSSRIHHANTTFEELAVAVREQLEDRDYEMQEILDDYLDYCYTSHLIPTADAWKYMRVQLAGTTLDFNIASGVYYEKSERGFRAHDYLGLYHNKSVRAVGKVCARITAIETENGLEYETEFGELTEERKNTIKEAIEDGYRYGYDLRTVRHRYFFVEQFYKTDFKKESKNAPMGSRVFDLAKILKIEEKPKMPKTEELAEMLKGITWEHAGE